MINIKTKYFNKILINVLLSMKKYKQKSNFYLLHNLNTIIKQNKNNIIGVECNSEESNIPGTFYAKITHQSSCDFICKFSFFFKYLIQFLISIVFI